MATNDHQPTWRPLPLEADDDLPPLMVSVCFTESSYTIHMTDLVHIWTESLGRKQIIMRGFQEDTSIDPSDGDNMKALLDKLRDAFDQSRPNNSRVTLSLITRRAVETAGKPQGWDLTVKYVFPDDAGLAPLQWPIHLEQENNSGTVGQLMLPLMHSHHRGTREVDALSSLLVEKDAVIAKLLDKLEAMGLGLENIFNSLPAKKKVTREVADGRIRGLAPFKRDEWSATLAVDAEAPPCSGRLIEEVFGGTGVSYQPNVEPSKVLSSDRWWDNFDRVVYGPVRRDSGAKPQVPTSPLPVIDDVGDGDDDFQVQVTPTRSRLAKSRKNTSLVSSPSRHADPSRMQPNCGPSIPKDDMSTEDEDPQASPTPKATAPPRMRLGMIGKGRQVKSPSPPLPPAPQISSPAAPPQPVQLAGDTAGGDETEAASGHEDLPPPASSPHSALLQPSRRGRLGRIGGKAKEKADDVHVAAKQSNSPSLQLEEAPLETQPGRRPRRLGMIWKNHEADEEDVPSGSRGRNKASSAAPERRRETSEERAHRRRRELEQEIAAKSAAPIKKRRKF